MLYLAEKAMKKKIVIVGLEMTSQGVIPTVLSSWMTYQDDTITTHEKHIGISLDDLKARKALLAGVVFGSTVTRSI
jgi:endonuclease V-like protein UPF0215 family